MVVVNLENIIALVNEKLLPYFAPEHRLLRIPTVQKVTVEQCTFHCHPTYIY